jgi:hypothetical protein
LNGLVRGQNTGELDMEIHPKVSKGGRVGIVVDSRHGGATLLVEWYDNHEITWESWSHLVGGRAARNTA